MDHLLPLFESDDNSSGEPQAMSTVMMSISQRDALKKAFEQLGVTDARGQFAIVEELTGQRIASVGDLEGPHAQTLIYKLADRIDSAGRKNTGNAWGDREEDTWIDKL
ncbi:hypothetical protein E3T24_05665 [Cryobacterium sp. TmT2-59]|uniref:hypothetical protein n=1 Tax=Cryobacterium sp. TmT2-59 TaxID=1259264 RepID=UPI00106AE4B3|nr:hypothetical protein [Cryobacterium sp. TmT2-59]TFC87149.1 hypothetical protein E3T24_05665 [Cryobacterium sp. TmT2-59]